MTSRPHRVVQALAGVALAAALLPAPQTAAAATEVPVPSGSASAPAEPTPTVTPSPPAPEPTPTPTPTPTPSKAPAKAKKAEAKAQAEPCGGTIVLGAVVDCPEIKDRERHVFSLTTTVAGERLLTQFREEGDGGQGLTAKLTGPDGTACFLGPYPDECVAGTAGTYTISVTLYSGTGTYRYVLGIDSKTHPSSCTALPESSLAFPATAREATLPAGSAGHCYSFDQAEGALVRIAVSGAGDVRGGLENAAGESICYLQDDRDCTLTGAGPYRFFLTEQYGAAVAYGLAVTRLSDPAGCRKVPVATFGDPGDRSAEVTVQPGGLACLTVTAEAGLHLLSFDNDQDVSWRIADRTGTRLCEKWGTPGYRCPLPAAGTYTFFAATSNVWDDPETFAVAVFALGSTQGCGPAVGTAWDSPPLRVPVTSPLQVDCNPLDARPGDRIDLRSGGWITDGTGERICDAADDGGAGCVLPASGLYRIITEPSWSDDPDNRSYEIEARRLNDPQGCVTVPVGRYGAAPAGAITANRCRTLTVPAAGTYHVEVVDDENYHQYGTVYDQAGARVCEVGLCTFPAAGSYTLVTDGSTAATVLLPATGAGNGCVTVSDQPTATPAKGTFRTAGQYDCLLLPTPTGAGLALLKPQDATGTGRPELTVYDATGSYECDIYQLRDATCVLEGTAPFRVVLHLDEDTDTVTGPYALSFARTTGGPACAALPGTGTPTSLTLSGDRYVGCFTVPAGQHSGVEAVSFRRTAGTGKARLSVFGPTGRRRCGTQTLDAAFTICPLEAGASRILVEGSAATGTFQLSRKDVTGTATGCTTITSTKVGQPSLTGSVTSRAELRCYQVAANATDRVLVDTRDTDNVSRAIVLDPDGADTSCAGYVSACSVTGRTKYQVLVWSLGTGSTPYQLDVWKVWANGKPPAECAPVPSAAYGFGPYRGTLSSTKPAFCVVAPTTYYDDQSIELTNPVSPDDGYSWDAGLYAVTGTAGMQSCAASTAGGFHCYSGRERVEPTVYLLTNGNRASAHPFQLEATCRNTSTLCGDEHFTVTAAAPATVPNGAKRTVTVRGTALHLRDTVLLTPSGSPAVTATVKSVSADRRTMTAEVDLTSAPTGPAGLSVDSFGSDGEPVVLATAFTITLPPLKATRAPTISGTVAVGSAVKVAAGSWSPAATSYRYQWAANGTAIKGATGSSYPVAAAVLGKRLTVTVTAARSGYPAGAATSAASAAVAKGKAPTATKKPAITGTAKVGRTVKVSAGTWSPKADSYRYEWRLGGKVVKGATKSSLKLTSSMRNKKLTVTVTTKKAGYADGKATSKAVTVRR
jgi:hypothetical protein